MKKIILLVCLFTVLFATAQTQDTLYVWKAGVLVHRQSLKPADMDSITFKLPINRTGINIAGPNVTDIDGNTYQSVTNCGITFTNKNLNVSRYSDGTPIPQVQNESQWAKLNTGAWCYYNNDPSSEAVYGKLYNWYAAAGIYDAASLANPALRKKLAPTGWRVPSDSEWSYLINCLDPKADGGNTSNIAGGKMKARGTKRAGTSPWQDPNTAATNESGFTGLPEGYRNCFGTFNLFGKNGSWWSSAEYNTTSAWSRYLVYYNGYAARFSNSKRYGFSVRCLMD